MSSYTDAQLNKIVKIQVNGSIIELNYKKSNNDAEGETRLSKIVSNKVDNILKKTPKKQYTLLVNLLDIGDTGSPSSAARKIYAKMGQSKQIKKVAVCGMSMRLKVISNFIARLTGRKEFHWFDNIADAKKWLKK